MSSGDATQPKEPDELTAFALDPTRPIAERMAAMDQLIELTPDAAKVAMLRIAERTVEPREILTAAGIGLARIQDGGVEISQFDMRDMCEIAFDAYCEWLPPE